MNHTTIVGKNLFKSTEVAFVIKFVVLMAAFYYFNIFYIAITDSNGQIYSSFLHNYLDYISWLRSSILHTANLIVHIFGLKAYISDIYTLIAPKGAGVIIGYTCLGYGVTSFWAAFTLAQEDSWKRKIIWCLAGIIGIWFINCWRIAILLIALEKEWQVNQYIDHHDMFTIAVYILILTLIYFYYRESKTALQG